MDGGAKKAMLAHVKTTFDGLRKAAGDPVLFLDKLPDNPVSFLRDSPSLYNVCFVADPPVVPAMSIQIIAAIDMSYGCRGGAAKLQPEASRNPALPAVSLQLGDSPMERMAAMMFQRMEAMATNQQRIMEMAMTGASHRASPRPLAALADNSPLTFRKLPTIAIGGSCLALGDASADSSGTPPPKLARRSFEVVSPTSEIPGADDTLEGEEETVEDCAEDAELAKMLDMMAARKAANSRKTKSTGDASGEGTVEALPAAAAKGKGQGKGKAKSIQGTGGGIGDAGNAKGNGKGKGKTKSNGKSNGKVTLKTKAKAKAKMLPKAVNKAAAPAAGQALVLGCSKCRWSKDGCAQCKNPKFKGLRFSCS
jgi:hypothetical protein